MNLHLFGSENVWYLMIKARQDTLFFEIFYLIFFIFCFISTFVILIKEEILIGFRVYCCCCVIKILRCWIDGGGIVIRY